MDADVIIVGAGPSGLVSAIEIALQGGQVIMLERRTEAVQSRAGTVLPRVLELFASRGYSDQFINRAKEIRDNPFLTFHIWAGMQPVQWRTLETDYPYRLIMPQNYTEQILREVAESAGVQIRTGHTVTDIRQTEDSVTVIAECGAKSIQLNSAYLVGADGGRSITRQKSNIIFEGHDGTFTGIIADLPLTMDWPEGRAMTDNEHGWGASFPFGDDGKITRFNFVHAERRKVPQSEPVTANEVRQCLKDIWNLDLEFDDVVWASRFSDAMRVATKLRDDRVFLVGESARIHYPASGVGMNFCIQDAFNLGWKLGRVVSGTSPDSILETYEAERMPVIKQLLESVKAQCAVQFDFSPEGISFRRMFSRDILPITEVNRELALQLNGLTDSYIEQSLHPALGRPVPPFMLQTAGGFHPISDYLRNGEFLLVDLTGNDVFRKLEFSGVKTITGVCPKAPAALSDATAILIRPDGYVHWISTESKPSDFSLRDALKEWVI